MSGFQYIVLNHIILKSSFTNAYIRIKARNVDSISKSTCQLECISEAIRTTTAI